MLPFSGAKSSAATKPILIVEIMHNITKNTHVFHIFLNLLLQNNLPYIPRYSDKSILMLLILILGICKVMPMILPDINKNKAQLSKILT